MSSILNAVTQSNAATTQTIQNHLPESSSRSTGMFKNILGIVSNIGSSILSATGNGLLGNAVSAASGNVSDTNSELIMAQIEMQKEMQITSMISNIEKSKHEAKMTPVRNIRVS